MRAWLLGSSLLWSLSAAVLAQEPAPRPRAPVGAASPGMLTSQSGTPEMWFYEQDRLRYEDSKAAVRRKAEFRAAQRQNRLASMRLYGVSNSRPTASPTPWTGTYAPTWTSNSLDPHRWIGPSQINVVRRPDGRIY